MLQSSQYSASSFSSTFLIAISSSPASLLIDHNKKTKNRSCAFRVLSDLKHPNKGSALDRGYIHSSLAQQRFESTFLQQADRLHTNTFKHGMRLVSKQSITYPLGSVKLCHSSLLLLPLKPVEQIRPQPWRHSRPK